MVGMHLLNRGLAAGIGEQFLMKIHDLADSDVIQSLLSWIVYSIVLPPRVDLFLQVCHPIG
jgi:hypothetical protein